PTPQTTMGKRTSGPALRREPRPRCGDDPTPLALPPPRPIRCRPCLGTCRPPRPPDRPAHTRERFDGRTEPTPCFPWATARDRRHPPSARPDPPPAAADLGEWPLSPE